MTYDSYNLPPGVSPSMLPGNSDRDMWLEKQREKIEEKLDILPVWLSTAVFGNEEDNAIAERCNFLYDMGDDIIEALEEARNLARQVEDSLSP